MSLLPEVYFERQWGRYPKLASLLAGRTPSMRWTGHNSSSDNIFEHFSRLLQTYALVVDNSSEVTQFIKESSDQDRGALMQELKILSKELNWAKAIIESMESTIQNLA